MKINVIKTSHPNQLTPFRESNYKSSCSDPVKPRRMFAKPYVCKNYLHFIHDGREEKDNDIDTQNVYKNNQALVYWFTKVGVDRFAKQVINNVLNTQFADTNTDDAIIDVYVYNVRYTIHVMSDIIEYDQHSEPLPIKDPLSPNDIGLPFISFRTRLFFDSPNPILFDALQDAIHDEFNEYSKKFPNS